MSEQAPAQRIGFIGLGIMGQAMAANVLKKGYALSIYNRTAGKPEAPRICGAAECASPAGVDDASDIIILMLTGPEAVEAVLHGDRGLLAGD